MKHYFDHINTLHQFTMTLDCQPDSIQCKHCSKQDQFVSHGFVYKKQHQGEPRIVGKRIFCSDRNGRSGCGRTIRLYLITELAFLHYTAAIMVLFLRALLNGSTIQKAYLAATQKFEPRNAYRWLNKLQRKLVDYRLFVGSTASPTDQPFRTKNKQRRILLSTLLALFELSSNCACYQQKTQNSFI